MALTIPSTYVSYLNSLSCRQPQNSRLCKGRPCWPDSEWNMIISSQLDVIFTITMPSSPRPKRPPVRITHASSQSLVGLERVVPPTFPSPTLSGTSSSSLHKPLPPTPLSLPKKRTLSVWSQVESEIIELYLQKSEYEEKRLASNPPTLFTEASRSLQSLHAPISNPRAFQALQRAHASSTKFALSDSALVQPLSPLSPEKPGLSTFEHSLYTGDVSPLTPSPPPLSPWPGNRSDQSLSDRSDNKAEALANKYRDTLLPDPFIVPRSTTLAYQGDTVPLVSPPLPANNYDDGYLRPLANLRSYSPATVSTVSSSISVQDPLKPRSLAFRGAELSSYASAQSQTVSFEQSPQPGGLTTWDENVHSLPSPIRSSALPTFETPYPPIKQSSRPNPRKRENNRHNIPSPLSLLSDDSSRAARSPSLYSPSFATTTNPSTALTTPFSTFSRSEFPTSIPSTPYRNINNHEPNRYGQESPLRRRKSRFSMRATAKRISEIAKTPMSPKPAKLQKNVKEKGPTTPQRIDHAFYLHQRSPSVTANGPTRNIEMTRKDSDSGIPLEEIEAHEISDRAARAVSQLYMLTPFNRSQTWPTNDSAQSLGKVGQSKSPKKNNRFLHTHGYSSSVTESSSNAISMSPTAFAASNFIPDPADSLMLPVKSVTAPLTGLLNSKLHKATISKSSLSTHSREASIETASSFIGGSRTSSRSNNRTKKVSWLRRSPNNDEEAKERWREETKKKITVKGVESTSNIWLVAGSSGAQSSYERNQTFVAQQRPEWINNMRRGLNSGFWDYDMNEEIQEEVENFEELPAEGPSRALPRMPALGNSWATRPMLSPDVYPGPGSEMDKVGGSWL